MPCEGQLKDARRQAGCVARGHGPVPELELEPEPELEREREHGRGLEHGRVLSAVTGSCSLAVVTVVQLEAMLIHCEVVDHTGLSSRVEGVVVHRHVDEVEADDVAGHNEDFHWHLPGADKKDQGRIEPRQSVVWLEGWAAKHRQVDMAVYE